MIVELIATEIKKGIIKNLPPKYNYRIISALLTFIVEYIYRQTQPKEKYLGNIL